MCDCFVLCSQTSTMKVCISALVDSIEGFWVLTNYKVDNGSGVMVLTHNMQRSAPLVAGVRKARGYAFTINLIVPRQALPHHVLCARLAVQYT